MESIFIQISSYHDYELPKTILNVVEKANGKYKIHFGIHNSYLEPNHIHIPEITKTENVKISVIESQAPSSIGVGASRALANSLYNGEDYYFQIDSHSRLLKDWDVGLVNCLKKYQECGVKKPLLTAYPSSYYYDDFLVERISTSCNITNIGFHKKPDFSNDSIPHQTAVPKTENISKSVSAGFIFTTGDFNKIAVNSKIAFWGEEIITAARAFTNGYDLLVPDKQYVFHLYFAHDKSFQHNLRRHVWKDWPEQFKKIDTESKAEVYEILSSRRTGPEALGNERSLDDYGNWAGLDFTNKTVK
jgi:hypothetical protein